MSGSDLAGSGLIKAEDDRCHEGRWHAFVEHHREHRIFIAGRRHVLDDEIGARLRYIFTPKRYLLGGAAFEIHLPDALAQLFKIDLSHRVILSSVNQYAFQRDFSTNHSPKSPFPSSHAAPEWARRFATADQYSLASMIVSTRFVCCSSHGASLP